MMVIKKSRDADKKNEPPAAAVAALVFVYVLGDSYFPVDYIWYIYTFSISFVDSVDMQVFRWRPTREIRGTCSFFSAPVIRVKYESRFMIFILFLLLVQLLVRIQEERLLLLLLLF
jgi:hypothetical protein